MTLRQITETINDVFYLYNITEGKYEYISPNCKLVLEADQEFFYSGKSHVERYIHADDRKKVLEANEKINQGIAYEIEYRVVGTSGYRWVNEKSFPIKSEDGKVDFNSGICRDVTDVKIAQDYIEEKNTEIKDSIAYAKNIQDSVLPTLDEMREILPESFVFYLPKDILSGDFYVVDKVRTNDHVELPIFIVADCTGHGVPGGS